MAEGRMLRKKISHNEELCRCSITANLVFDRLIPHLDVEGRITGNARLLKATVFPLLDAMTVADIQGGLHELTQAVDGKGEPLVCYYEVDGRSWLWFPGFDRNQTLRKDKEAGSRIPPPPPLGQLALFAPPGHLPEDAGTTPGLLPEDAGTTPGLLPEDSGTTPGLLRGKEKGSKGKRSEVEVKATTTAPAMTMPDAPTPTAMLGNIPEPYRRAFRGVLRAARNPDALLAELQAIHDGLHGPPRSWEVIGRAIHEHAVAGGPLTAAALQAFCRRIADGPRQPSGTTVPLRWEPQTIEQAAAARRRARGEAEEARA